VDATLLYAGNTLQNNPWNRHMPVYRKIQAMKLADPSLATKKTLNEVLEALPAPDTVHTNMLAYADHVDNVVSRDKVAAREQILIWRALSGIYASNARGAVSFIIGAGVSTDALKVFALTEIHVLMRNSRVDAVTREMAEYLKRCVLTHTSDVMIGLIRNT
jgi:hypothetical protein